MPSIIMLWRVLPEFYNIECSIGINLKSLVLPWPQNKLKSLNFDHVNNSSLMTPTLLMCTEDFRAWSQHAALGQFVRNVQYLVMTSGCCLAEPMLEGVDFSVQSGSHSRGHL